MNKTNETMVKRKKSRFSISILNIPIGIIIGVAATLGSQSLMNIENSTSVSQPVSQNESYSGYNDDEIYSGYNDEEITEWKKIAEGTIEYQKIPEAAKFISPSEAYGFSVDNNIMRSDLSLYSNCTRTTFQDPYSGEYFEKFESTVRLCKHQNKVGYLYTNKN